MDHVERSAGDRRPGDDFLEARDAAANVHVHGSMVASRRAEDLEDLPLRRGSGVGRTEPDRHRALAQSVVYPPHHLRDLGGRRHLVRGVAAGQESAGIVEHRHPHLDVADAHAVVDQPARFPLLVPAIDIASAHFELE